MTNLYLSASLNICEHLREIIYYLLSQVTEPIDIIVLNQKSSSTNSIVNGLLMMNDFTKFDISACLY